MVYRIEYSVGKNDDMSLERYTIIDRKQNSLNGKLESIGRVGLGVGHRAK